MASIELDWADEDANPDLETSGRRAAAHYGLTMEVITEKGPGGWPVYRFTGQRLNIVHLVCDYAPDAGEAEELLATIKDGE